MKNHTIITPSFRRIFGLIVVVCCSTHIVLGQVGITPYDNLPGMSKSYKPAYEENFPSWAKKMYQTPVNFNEVNAEFEVYMSANNNPRSPIVRYFKIWRRVVADYVLADGSIQIPDQTGLDKDMFLAQTAVKNRKKSILESNSNWTFLGPKETFWLNESSDPEFVQEPCPWQVNVYCFDVAPSDSNILYCGTETSFVNKSTDKGLHWTLLGQDYPFGGAVTSVAIDPQNPEIVYASAGRQVHKTSDGGMSWKPLLASAERFSSDKLKIDPSNPNKIYAAAYEGIYLSEDAGESWQKKWDDAAYDLELKPGVTDTSYFITKNSSGKFAIVISNDGGVTFSTESNFPSGIAESSGGLLAVTAANPNRLFAVMLSANDTPYLYRGTFLNGSWTWQLIATGKSGSLPMTNYQGFFDLVLDVSPLDENIILTGTASLYKSMNGGKSFTLIGGYGGTVPVHPDIQDLRMLPGGETWVSTDGGFTYTTDNFADPSNSRARNNGLIGSDMWGFDQGWNEDIVVGGRYHNGNTAISDLYGPKALRMGGAESATGWVIQGKSRHVAFNDLGNGWILPQYADGKPKGRFLFSKFPNMIEYGGRRSNMVYHTNYFSTIYIGEGSSIWRSNDMGNSFDMLYTFPDMVLWFQISYSNPLVMYADVVGKGLYKSTNGGVSWVAKPKLTDGTVGTSYWNGKLFFAVSPTNENTLYACLQNGTWTADAGKVFKSTNGGTTWTDFSGSLSNILTKCLVIQPDTAGSDLVYLFSTAKNGAGANVYYRDKYMSDWEEYNLSYPAGMTVNLALPFFRDSKLRVAGNGSVWESPLAQENYRPLINPWVEKAAYNCMTDTVYFEDHSILNHAGASWKWNIFPAPAYISDSTIRNPKAVLGAPGKYTVSLSVTSGGKTYSRKLVDMISAITCPSIDNCDNPAEIPKTDWKLIFVDSQESGTAAIKAFDGNPATFWETGWKAGNVPYPHEIQIDLGREYQLHKLLYLPRQDGSENGRIKGYELYVSNDKANWGTAIKSDSLLNTINQQEVRFDIPSPGRYLKLNALSEVNGKPWTSAAEISLIGCNFSSVAAPDAITQMEVSAYPLPVSGLLNIQLPATEARDSYSYAVFSSTGYALESGKFSTATGTSFVDFSRHPTGTYFLRIQDSKGKVYRLKVIKLEGQ